MKAQACRENIVIPVKKGCQIASHGQASTEACNDPTNQSLQQAPTTGRPAPAHIACEQRHAQGTEKHAGDHDAIDPVQRGALQTDELEIAPFLRMEAEPGQYMSSPTGKFSGDGPERMGEREVIRRKETQGDQCWKGSPEADKVRLTKMSETGEHVAKPLKGKREV